MKIDQIIYSKRKSFSLQIQPDGRLIVRAPQNASREVIDQIVQKKAAWIQKTRTRLAQTFPDLKPRTFQEGELFWYLGKQYPLQFSDRQRPLLNFENAFMLSKKEMKRAREIFIAWYRERTREWVHKLVNQYQTENEFQYGRIMITSARTRWGSCSGHNNLNFTYRLAMAPLSVIEYVVVHEIAHLAIRNHSQKFWDKVQDMLPSYQKQRDWLKTNGARLTLD